MFLSNKAWTAVQVVNLQLIIFCQKFFRVFTAVKYNL